MNDEITYLDKNELAQFNELKGKIFDLLMNYEEVVIVGSLIFCLAQIASCCQHSDEILHIMHKNLDYNYKTLIKKD